MSGEVSRISSSGHVEGVDLPKVVRGLPWNNIIQKTDLPVAWDALKIVGEPSVNEEIFHSESIYYAQDKVAAFRALPSVRVHLQEQVLSDGVRYIVILDNSGNPNNTTDTTDLQVAHGEWLAAAEKKLWRDSAVPGVKIPSRELNGSDTIPLSDGFVLTKLTAYPSTANMMMGDRCASDIEKTVRGHSGNAHRLVYAADPYNMSFRAEYFVDDTKRTTIHRDNSINTESENFNYFSSAVTISIPLENVGETLAIVFGQIIGHTHYIDGRPKERKTHPERYAQAEFFATIQPMIEKALGIPFDLTTRLDVDQTIANMMAAVTKNTVADPLSYLVFTREVAS